MNRVTVPVLLEWNHDKVVGQLSVDTEALPASPEFAIAIGYRNADELLRPVPWHLVCACIVSDANYAAYLAQQAGEGVAGKADVPDHWHVVDKDGVTTSCSLRDAATQPEARGVEVADGLCDPVRGARFGHHPDPAIDFCIEVESLESRMFDARHGIGKPGEQPETVDSVREAIERALQFRVGGDLNAIAAKTTLRALAPNPVRAEQPTCPKCGATSEDDAGSKCIPDGDSCPGTEPPLAQMWAEQPEGKWKLVPVEATPEMINAATVYQYGPGGPNYDHASRWKAMLAAAPAAPAVGVDALANAAGSWTDFFKAYHRAAESGLPVDWKRAAEKAMQWQRRVSAALEPFSKTAALAGKAGA